MVLHGGEDGRKGGSDGVGREVAVVAVRLVSVSV